MRLVHDLTALELLTREPRCHGYALLESRLGPETTRLAHAAAGGLQPMRVPRTIPP